MQMYHTKILGTGVYLPKKILHNTDLEKMVETNDQWIFERTGIRERRISSTEGGEWPAEMAHKASLDALKTANLLPDDIDLIVFASVTPDYKLPNSASVLQTSLGITNKCAAIDIAVACSGFVYGLCIADSMIKTGAIKNALVVGSEMLSREVNWKDRASCILFGDGCGVAVVGRAPANDSSSILASTLGADGSGREYFDQPIGGAVEPISEKHLADGSHFMQMKGREMFKVATRTLADSARKVCDMAKVDLKEIDWLIPHQANLRIIETTGNLLGIDPQKVVINIEKYGNTSAATIPIAFHESIQNGKIKRGDLVLFDTFGAGLTFGAALIRY